MRIISQNMQNLFFDFLSLIHAHLSHPLVIVRRAFFCVIFILVVLHSCSEVVKEVAAWHGSFAGEGLVNKVAGVFDTSVSLKRG